MPNVYNYSVKARKGATLDLSSLRGKVLLVVNTATGCGFTPQYEGLGKLYAAYHGKGLEILDFTVRDRPALRGALAAELAPLFPGRTFAVNFDTDYTD